jgi:hypothetical protein
MGLMLQKPQGVAGSTAPAILVGLFVAFGGVLFGYANLTFSQRTVLTFTVMIPVPLEVFSECSIGENFSALALRIAPTAFPMSPPSKPL